MNQSASWQINQVKVPLRPWAAFAALFMLGFLPACNSSGDNGGAAAPGAVSVSLTDAPACGFEQVNITVTAVRVHQSSSADEKSSGWSDMTLNPPRTINLLDLNDPTQPNFALEQLGVTPLQAGHYTQLRLVLDKNNGNQPNANWIVLEGQNPNNVNNRIPLDTPSAIQSGIKLIHEFTVGSGQQVDLLLDFDACKSIVQTGNGNYKLKPVIRVVPTQLNGIKGVIDKTLPNVRVSAQQSGDVVRETVMNRQTGEFFVAYLPPGTYDVVITADDHTAAVISGVPVATNTSTTVLSTSGAPFSLASSPAQAVHGTVVLAPADDDASVVMAAKQMLNFGPTVTVKSQVASVIVGNPNGDYSYALTLPTGPTALAAYGPLPIVPTAAGQSSAAKLYSIKGSALTDAAVYGTQAPSPSAKDITLAANQTQDFTLTSP